jgi:cyclic lactone autoinducer peptide
MALNFARVIQGVLTTLTQTAASASWLYWHQEDQTVPRSTPRYQRNIPCMRNVAVGVNVRARACVWGSIAHVYILQCNLQF